MKKYWYNRFLDKQNFYGTLIGLVIVVFHILFIMLPKTKFLDGSSIINIPATVWIGFDLNTIFSSIFYLLIPFFACLGANLIFIQDIKSLFFYKVIQQINHKGYTIGLIIVSFMTGFLSIFIPLTVDFVFSISFFPNINPDIILNANQGITSQFTYFSNLYFTNPNILIGIYILFASLLGALFSLISCCFSLFIKNYYSTVIICFAVSMILTILSNIFSKIIYSPVYVVIGNSPSFLPSLWTILLLYMFFVFLSIFFIVLGVKKNASI